jgi:hypothetical protein
MTRLVKTVVVSLLVVVVAALVLYRSCAVDRHLDVDPNGRKAIEKAKRK